MTWLKWQNKVLTALLIASLTALAGWIYTTGNRVTALEISDKALDRADLATIEKLNEIHKDVREIRSFLMRSSPKEE